MSDDELRKIFRRHMPGVDWQAVETGSTGSGVPDLNGCRVGVEFWLEMKQATHWRITIRPMQVAWCERRLRNGGRVFCAVRRAHDELWLFNAWAMRRLMTERLDAVESLGRWSGGAAAWNWSEITRLLTA
jgi:hypothetical protein